MMKLFKAWLAKLDAKSKAIRAEEVTLDTLAKIELKEVGDTLGIYANGFLISKSDPKTPICLILDELTYIRNLAIKNALGEI